MTALQRYAWTSTGMRNVAGSGGRAPTEWIRAHEYDRELDGVREALRAVVDAYRERFGRGGNYLGPIDEEIKAAEKVLR